MSGDIEIAGGYGKAFALTAGQALRITNTFGTQVVDTWALAWRDTSEHLSVEQTRRMNFNLFAEKGDRLWTNRREPLLLLEEDTSPGRHDMLFSACDRWVYKSYGCPPGHRNCQDNFHEALFAAGFGAERVPNPLNLWMSIPVTDNARLALDMPLSKAGDHVLLRALRDTIIVLSTCPMDVSTINGPDRTPKSVHVRVLPR